jgi:YVTN family beta-propeller protein
MLGVTSILSAAVMLVGGTLPTAAQQEPTPFPLFALPDARLSTAESSSTMALAENNRTLVVVNSLNDSLSVVSVSERKLAQEIPVGDDPRSVALTDDGERAVTANRGDGTLTVVTLDTGEVVTLNAGGTQPYGVVIDGAGRVYVSLQGSNSVAVVDLSSGQVIQRIPTPPQPSGLALWGDFLYVTHFWTGQISLIYLPTGQVAETLSTGLDTGLSQAIELDITRGLAYLPQTRSNAQNRFLTFDSTVFPVVNILDLRDLSVQREQRIALDAADQPVNMPFAVALDRFKRWLFVANAGSDNVSVIDLNTGLARAHIPVGSSPRGLLLNRDNSLLFVHNALEGTIDIVETRNLTLVDELPISDFNIPVDTILAAQLFYSAVDPRMSYGNWISCANCHFDGQSDRRVWRGFPDGPRNTPVLYNLLETQPYNASGSWDELADVELKIRWLQAGTGLIRDGEPSAALGDPHTGRSFDLDVLTSYLATLQGPPVPGGSDPAQVARGEAVFNEQQCGECHVNVTSIDRLTHDVGTGLLPGERQGTAFDTPPLRWLWETAPYFHDGSAATLRDVFIQPGAHQIVQRVSAGDLDALIAFLLTLG